MANTGDRKPVKYRVWVEIETEFDDETHEDDGNPELLATCDTYEEAEAAAGAACDAAAWEGHHVPN